MSINYIVSHPIRGNYGGMLQAVALSLTISTVLENKVVYINLQSSVKKSLVFMLCRLIRYLLHVSNIRLSHPLIVAKHTNKIKRFLPSCVDCLPSDIKSVISNADCLIVGSDQVWRMKYVREYGGAFAFFGGVLPKAIRLKSITYAASFGSDEWDGTEDETVECARLLHEFKAVSVREHSGVNICKDVFGVDAVQMPDPTLLLYTGDYIKIIDSAKTWQLESKYVAAYVLDETAGKAELLQECASALNLHLQHLMPHANAKKRRDRFPISVPQWLRLIRDCEYFVTDSFHGCVFAIIYNKPFVCLGNEGRGNARFDTLLGTFGLEDRLVTDATQEKVMQVLKTPIDWERVNAIHDVERERGINFLKENLT